MTSFSVKKTASIVFLATCISPLLYSDYIVDHDTLFEECRAVPQFHSDDFSSAQIEACRELVRSDRVDLEAHFYLGRLLYLNIMHEDAEKLFLEGYHAGSTKAALAYALVTGAYKAGVIGIAEDEARAIFKDAADSGDPVAKVLLGKDLIFREKEPSELDKETAYYLFEQAAQQGYPIANFYLAEFNRYFCAEEGDYCKKVIIEYLWKAAKGGVRDAANHLEARGENIDRFGSLDDMLYQIPDHFSMILLRP